MSENIREPVQYAVSADESVSESVVYALAEYTGCSPLDLDPPLASVVDPDALDQFFVSVERDESCRPGSITFRYDNLDVTVDDGVVEVHPGETPVDAEADD